MAPVTETPCSAYLAVLEASAAWPPAAAGAAFGYFTLRFQNFGVDLPIQGGTARIWNGDQLLKADDVEPFRLAVGLLA